MAKTSCKKGQYYCNTDKKCKPIPRGFTVREDGFLVREGWSAKYKKSIDCNNPKGFSQKAHCAGKKKKMTEESNPRIARKKGQPAKSKKHSDLYTDEDPKGTIHGLGFKDVATAKASVAKIRKSGRSHAHKIQAAIAMEQRARVMGKTSEAAVYRKFINSMKKKTKAMNEEKHGDHEYEMIRRQADNIMVNAKKLKKKVGKGEGNAKAWVQSKITKAADYLDTAADYMTDKDNVKEGTLHKWFKGSKSKDGKGGWVNVLTGGTCASDEPGEGVPKCVSRAKYERMTPAERRSAARRKKAADPGQQEKTGAAKPTYVKTDKPKKKKKMKEEFVSLPLQLEVPQSDGEFKCGLMFRESLEQDRGMLFIFESDDYWTFHMKNTFIPLDIAFIKEDGTIDSIKELDPMNPIPVYPDSEIRYAVEVNRGWFAENDVNVGDALLEEEDLTEGKDKKGKGSGKKDACYYKVKSRYSVWPSAYASGALVKCRKVGAANWGNKSESVEYKLEEKKKIDYSEYPELVAQGRGGKTANVDVEPAALKTYRNVRSTLSLVPSIGKRLLGDKDAFKKHEKAERKRYKNPQGVERIVTGIADKMTGDKYDFDRKGPSKTKKEHYSWRDSFDNEELDEQLLGAIRRAGSAVGSAVGGAVQKVGSALKAKPIVRKPGQTSVRTRGGGAPQVEKPQQQKQPAPQAQQTTQQKPVTPAPKMGRTEIANREKLGNARVDALKAKNQEFQAAKKSGNLKQFRADNPKLSGRERAQQMARARLAAKKVNSNTPTPTKTTVEKPAGTPVRNVTSSTTQSGNTTSTQTNVQSGVKGGTTKDLVSSSGSLQKNKLKAKQIANNANKNAAMSGSGATTTVGKIDDF